MITGAGFLVATSLAFLLIKITLHKYRKGDFDKVSDDRWRYNPIRYPDAKSFLYTAVANLSVEFEKPRSRGCLWKTTKGFAIAMNSLLKYQKVDDKNHVITIKLILKGLDVHSDFFDVGDLPASEAFADVDMSEESFLKLSEDVTTLCAYYKKDIAYIRMRNKVKQEFLEEPEGIFGYRPNSFFP